MKVDFLPYFVTYRVSFPDGDQPLFLEYFLTLSELFEYIRLNKERWVFYSVGRTLEVFNQSDGSGIGEVHSYRL